MNLFRNMISPLIVFLFLASVFGCGSLHPYRFEIPDSSDDIAMARLERIDAEIDKLKEEPGHAEVVADYFLEAGLIHEKIFRQDQEAIYYYRKALEAAPGNCDVKMLLAAVLSRKYRSSLAVEESQQLLLAASEQCPLTTLLMFNRAKLDILSPHPRHLAQSRDDLIGLSTIRLGRSGATRNQVVSLLVYGDLKEHDLQAAMDCMAKYPEVQVLPKLQALIYIGNGDLERLRRFSSSPDVLEFLLRIEDIEDLLPMSELEKKVISLTEDMHVNTRISDEMEQSGRELNPIEVRIRSVDRQEDARLLEHYLQDRKEVVGNLKSSVERMHKAKRTLLLSELNHHLGGKPKRSEVYQKYVRSRELLEKAFMRFAETSQKIIAVGKPENLLDKPETILNDAALLQIYMLEQQRPRSEASLVTELFREFALNKTQALNYVDFFEPFSVDLNDLSSASNTIKASIRKLTAKMGMEGQEASIRSGIENDGREKL